ncbi:MAG: metallophosphoesterase [Bacteroidales bacterium]
MEWHYQNDSVIFDFSQMYDFIGDTHGEAKLLKRLLLKLNYVETDGVYEHPKRKAVFLGDFINRGHKVKKTVGIIRSMVERGSGIAILGNHEINLILYYFAVVNKVATPIDGNRLYSEYNVERTLKEYKDDEPGLSELVRWLTTLPLFFEQAGVRAVHACWRDKSVAYIRNLYPDFIIPEQGYLELLHSTSKLSKHVSILTKGIAYKVPNRRLVKDRRGKARRHFRMKWWLDNSKLTYAEMDFDSRLTVPDVKPKRITVPSEHYGKDEVPVFFGHYSRIDEQLILADNVCCLDAGVSKGGRLAAYRYHPKDKRLLKRRIVFVKR